MRQMMKLFCMLFAMYLAQAATPGLAQADYPNKTIKVVVPFAAGGATDQVARMLAERMSKQMGVSVIVENRAGANGNIGAEFVAKSAPDGYTILHNTSSIAFTAAFQQKVGYDLFADLAPVSELVTQPLLIVAGPAMPANNIPELLAWAKVNTGKLSYASSGVGNISHLVMFVLLQSAGINGAHVPYKGGAAAFPDLIGGQVHLLADPINSALPFVKDKRVRALATSGKGRSALLPDVPAAAESWAPGFEAGAWQAAMVPAKTPTANIRRLNTEMVKALNEPEVREKLAAQGAEVVASSPEQYDAYLRSEIERWTKVVKASGAKLD